MQGRGCPAGAGPVAGGRAVFLDPTRVQERGEGAGTVEVGRMLGESLGRAPWPFRSLGQPGVGERASSLLTAGETASVRRKPLVFVRTRVLRGGWRGSPLVA